MVMRVTCSIVPVKETGFILKGVTVFANAGRFAHKITPFRQMKWFPDIVIGSGVKPKAFTKVSCDVN